MYIYLPIAEISVNIYLLLLFGTLAGITAGAFGIGGNFLLIPLLLSIGISSAVALSSALGQAVTAAVSSFIAYYKNKHIDTKVGKFLLIGSIIGVVIGTNISHFLHNIGLLDTVISILYIVILGSMGCVIGRESIAALLHKKRIRNISKKSLLLAQMPWQKGYFATANGNVLTLVLSSAIMGLISAISGTGGGFIVVPMLMYIYKIPTIIAIGTSTYQALFVAATATFMHSLQSHTLDIVLSIILMIGSAIGAQIGYFLSSKLPGEVLRLLLACIMLTLFCKLAMGLIITPEELYSLKVI